MRLYYVIILILIIETAACSKSHSSFKGRDGREKEKLADDVIRKTALKMKQEAHLHPCGTMGQMRHTIQKLGISFFYFQPIDIVEGRKLLIRALNTMMSEVDQEKKIHPYLDQYPFTPWNLEIIIFLRNVDGRDVPLGTLCLIEARERNLIYKIHHSQTGGLRTIYKETYEDALQRIADPSLPFVVFPPSLKQCTESLHPCDTKIASASKDGDGDPFSEY